MLATRKHAANDDLESQRRNVRAPEMCVDYLSYQFDEMDLAASWRVMTKQKKDIVNGLRLENASWRTWAKHKNKLKTVSPETLNWLKDSDVTWLYGPLHTVIKNIEEEDRYAKPKVTTAEDKLGLMTPSPAASNRTPSQAASTSSSTATSNSNTTTTTPQKQPLKSALKKVTTSDLLRRSASELQAHALLDANKSRDPSMSLTEANRKLKAFSPSVIATHRQPKLRFNQYVEQCVALYNEGPRSTSRRVTTTIAEESDTEDGNEGYSDDENAIVLDYDRPSTIRKIAPTRLKSSSQSEQDTDDVSSLSSSSGTSTGGYYPWTASQENSDASSSEDDELVMRSRSSRQSASRSQETDAIQWIGQSCVYNVRPPPSSDNEDDLDFDDDDDDWDTHDVPPSPPLPPAAPTPTSPTLSSSSRSTSIRGRQNLGKSVPVSEPCPVEASEPSITRVANYQKIAQIQRVASQLHGNEGEASSSSSSSSNSSTSTSNHPSLFGHLAQWASSYLWPKPTPSSSAPTTSSSSSYPTSP